MTDPTRLRLSRAILVTLGGLFLVALLFPAQRAITRELHSYLPASTWLVVERVEPIVAADGTLDLRIRGQRHRAHDSARTIVTECISLDAASRYSRDWRQIGDTQTAPEQSVSRALIGYAEDEPAPEGLEGVERISGYEFVGTRLPTTPHRCKTAVRWAITTDAGHETRVVADTGEYPVALPPPLEPEPAPVPAAPPAATLIDEATAEPALTPIPKEPPSDE